MFKKALPIVLFMMLIFVNRPVFTFTLYAAPPSDDPNPISGLSRGTSNLTHGYDKNEVTSANILTDDGYILYKLADIGLDYVTTTKYIIGTSDGGAHTIRLEYLDDALQIIGSRILNVSGVKNEYRAEIPTNAIYVKINGVAGILIYIFEIDKYSPFAASEMSRGTSNLPHGYDKNDITSANILTDDGYILYKLADIGLDTAASSKYILGTSDRVTHKIRLEYLNNYLQNVGTLMLNVSGAKNGYRAAIPENASYVKINGVPGVLVYIFEIEKYSPFAASEKSHGTSNLPHGYDKNDVTSANILTDDGYIIYRLSDLGLQNAAGSKYIIGTSDGGNHSIQLEYLDESLQVVGGSSLHVSGVKNEYKAGIPQNATYVKIIGVPGILIYVFEINEYSPFAASEMSRGTSNLTHGYDKNEVTSANILTDDGYIIYRLSDLGLQKEAGSKYILGTSDGGNHNIQLEYLDDHLQLVSSSTLNVYGAKNEYTTWIPDNTCYVKIKGTPGILIYLFEIMSN